MNSNVPIVTQFTWKAMPPQLLMILIFSTFSYFLKFNDFLGLHGLFAYVIYGSIIQLLLWLVISNIYLKNHNNGINLVKQEMYSDAIRYFVDSYDLISKHSWVDKYRHFLGASSKIAYREMDLNNIAFCYGQIGEKEKSIEYYNLTLKEFPDSGLAKAALKLIETLTQGQF